MSISQSASSTIYRPSTSGGAIGGGFSVHINLDGIRDLQRCLQYAGANYKQSYSVIAQSMNRGGARMRTDLTRKLVHWTGVRRRSSVFKRITPVIATPRLLVTGIRVRSPHMLLTKEDFGATWQRTWPGARHSAWSRRVTAKGSFMAAGRTSGRVMVFKRLGKGRTPIKPLYGPNVAREMTRHENDVRLVVRREAIWVHTEVVRRARAGILSGKTKFGL